MNPADPNSSYSDVANFNNFNTTTAAAVTDPTAAPWAAYYATVTPPGGDVGGQTLGATTTYQAPDPYARWDGQANYNNLVSGFNTQKQNIYGSANDAAANTGLELKGSILDYVGGLTREQRGIDSQAARNELAKSQGTAGVMGMVGRGIRSGGVMLANKNAGDSSAAQAIANAYGEQGRRQLSGIGNQYEMGNEDVRLAQLGLEDQRAAGARKIADSKTQAVNNIVMEARDKLGQLDASMANASMPERIAIEQEREAIKQQVLGQLQQYDQMLATESSRVAPTSIDQRREEAARLGRAGTDLGADAFNFTEAMPGQFQGTGPYASELPLFTLPRRRTA